MRTRSKTIKMIIFGLVLAMNVATGLDTRGASATALVTMPSKLPTPYVTVITAGCYVVTAQHLTGIYVVIVADGISVSKLQAYFVYSAGEHVRQMISPERAGDSFPAGSHMINPLISSTVASAALCPESILITSAGDQITVKAPLKITYIEFAY